MMLLGSAADATSGGSAGTTTVQGTAITYGGTLQKPEIGSSAIWQTAARSSKSPSRSRAPKPRWHWPPFSVLGGPGVQTHSKLTVKS